jgi:uncharacterized membrane protein YbhN (UPF0104 family)
VLDRASDLVALVLLLAVSLWTVSQEAWIRRVALGGLLVIALVAAVLLAARSYVGRRARDRHQRRGLLRRLARDLADGLAEPLGRRRAAVALCLSLLAWGCFAAAAVLVARSVGVRLGLLDALFVTGVMNLGVAIPSSPGFVGTYQWLGVSSLGLLGTGREEALAFSILLQASWYVPTTLVGAVLLATRALRGVRQRPRRDPFEI